MMLLARVFGWRTAGRPTATQITIEVTVSGDISAPRAHYRRIDGGVGSEGERPVVSPNGDVDLKVLPPSMIADDNSVGITFRLIGSVKCAGRERPVRFRRRLCKAFRIRQENGDRPTPGQFLAFFPDRPGGKCLTVDDRNDDDRRYLYCLGIRARGCCRAGKLDPSIINR